MIVGNNHVRNFLDSSDVPESEKDEYNLDETNWVHYKGMYIPLCDFMRNDDIHSKWGGIYGLTNTSSIVIQILDSDQYKIGLAL